MNLREKILATLFGTVLVVAMGYLGVKKLYLDRDSGYDGQRRKLIADTAKLKRENDKIAGAAESIRSWAGLTYDTDELRASAKIGATLMALVERAGLNPEKLSLQPSQGSRVRGAYKEIGRTISVRGKLQNIVDFLYLLEQEPHLHRLDNLSILPQHKTNEIDLQVRYITLVLDSTKTEDVDTVAEMAPTDLDGEGRELLDVIASRDLFRPYIQRRAAPPPPPTSPRSPSPPRYTPPRTPVKPTATPRPSTGRQRIVGLPTWSNNQEVLVSDSSSSQLRTYRAGDTLGGGTIVMVDYRALPSPANPQMLSPSRVIIRKDPDYWAVELGQELTEQRRLARDQLPAPIRSLPQPPPAEGVKENDPAER